MNRILGVLLIVLATTGIAWGQLRTQVEAPPSVAGYVAKPVSSSLFLGFLDPSAFSMRHSYSLSYTSFAGQGLSMGVYTNSMFYKISDPLDVQVDFSLMHSPYNTLGSEMQNQLSGLFISRAQLNYRPSDNMWFQIQFRQVPPMYWMGNYRTSNFFHGIDRYEGEYR